jgi:hypothetical protein
MLMGFVLHVEADRRERCRQLLGDAIAGAHALR